MPEGHQYGLAGEIPGKRPFSDRKVVGFRRSLAMALERMIHRGDESAARDQHSMQLCQRRRPVLQVVENQGSYDVVETSIIER